VDERCLKEDLVPGLSHGQSVSILVAGVETGGRSALVEMVEERGSEAPCHLHHWEDEALYVLEGSLSVWVAGRWVEAPVGAAVFLARGVEHALAVAAERARVLSFFAPAGFEGFYRELGATSAPDVERHGATAARYGCEIVGPAPERARGGGALPGTTTRAAARDRETQEVRAGREE
jgi:quercetin dioxygenase-like cupin family protein